MSRIRLISNFLGLIVTDTKALAKNLFHFTEDRNARRVAVHRHGFVDGLPTIDILDLLPGFSEAIRHYTYLDGTSRPIDIAVLKGLCSQHEECSYLEIGTWRGESLANVADVCAECYSVSLSDEEMRERGFGGMVPFQRLFSKNRTNVVHIGHDSATFDFDTIGKKFDVIFVDGDHMFEGVRADTATAFRLLKDEDSVIVWHDYGYEQCNWSVLAGILDGCPEDAKSYLYSLSNTLCAIYTKRNLPSKNLRPPQIPTKTFDITISAVPIDSND